MNMFEQLLSLGTRFVSAVERRAAAEERIADTLAATFANSHATVVPVVGGVTAEAPADKPARKKKDAPVPAAPAVTPEAPTASAPVAETPSEPDAPKGPTVPSADEIRAVFSKLTIKATELGNRDAVRAKLNALIAPVTKLDDIPAEKRVWVLEEAAKIDPAAV